MTLSMHEYLVNAHTYDVIRARFSGERKHDDAIYDNSMSLCHCGCGRYKYLEEVPVGPERVCVDVTGTWRKCKLARSGCVWT